MTLGGVSFSNKNANITYNQISFITTFSPIGSSQVSIYVNGIQAICGINSSSLCNYQFSSTIAPTIYSGTPLNVSGPANMTIIGSNFGNDATKLTVKIGNDNCNITAATNSTIVCRLLSLSVGPQNVLVNLKGTKFLIISSYVLFSASIGIGNSIQTSSFVINGIAAIASFSQRSGSIFGGSIFSITGNGFGNSLNTQVKIGAKFCSISSVSSSQVICLTPSYSVGNYSVSITSNNISFPSTSFIYNSSLTPNISQVSPSFGNSNQIINIYGSGFGKSISNKKLKSLKKIHLNFLFRWSKRVYWYISMYCAKHFR